MNHSLTRALQLIGFGMAAAFAAAALAVYPDTPPSDADYGQQHNLLGDVPQPQFPFASDAEGAAGMSIVSAWMDPSLNGARTGRSDVLIAYLEGGINWHLGDASRDLVNKVYLNRGELPKPRGDCRAPATDPWDCNADGRFNIKDYAGDSRVSDKNGNGFADPEDLIAVFSDGRDDDGNGYADDISGWDFYNRQNDPATTDAKYPHANAQMRKAAGETDNGLLFASMCPDCMILPVKVGAEALNRGYELAQGMLFAADAGASVITTENAQIGYGSTMREVHEYLWRHDVLVAETSNDFDSTDHQGGMYWPHSVPGNGLVRDTGFAVGEANELTSRTTRGFRVRSGQTSWGTKNLLSVATIGGSTSESTGTLGGVLGAIRACAREFSPPQAPYRNDEILQTTLANAADVTPADNPKWPAKAGWDLQTGYGRPNVHKTCLALKNGDIAPVAWFDAPEWFTLHDPTVKKSLAIRGHVEARRSPSYSWTLEYGLGAEPETFTSLGSGAAQTAFDGALGTLDLSQIPEEFYKSAFKLSQRKELESTEQYTLTLRLTVTDAQGRKGEERRSIFIHRDDSWFAGFPVRINRNGASSGEFSPGGESQPALVDLQGQGHLAIVFGDTDGYVHAIDPLTRTELPGWPVTTDAITPAKNYPGVSPRFDPLPYPLAVGDLDHDGRLWVVGTTLGGSVYVWNDRGERRAGWPRALDEGVTALPIPRVPKDYSRPAIQGAVATPVLFDLDGDGSLDIIQSGWNGRIHVWNAQGQNLPGWPVKVEVPASLTPPNYVRINDEKLIAAPAVADLDGDGRYELVIRSQQNDTMGVDIQPAGVIHVSAYHADGTPVSGWPNSLPSTIMYYGSAQEFITEGTNSPVAADVDGDGRDEIAVNPLFSPAYLLGGDGRVRTIYGAAPALNAAQVLSGATGLDALNAALAADVPVGFTTSGAFGRFGMPPLLSYAQAGSGAASVAAALLYTGSGTQLKNYERAVNARTGLTLPGFPAFLQGLNFVGSPLFVDVTGDGAAEIVDGGDSQALHAYTALGAQAAGFPKFTSGWTFWSPAAGDLDSDGSTELVSATREGYLFVWKTPGLSSSNTEWWHYRHDEWNSGRYGTDTRPPGIVRNLSASAGALSFTAPGDNWYAGTVAGYRLTAEDGTRREDLQRSNLAAAGQTETLNGLSIARGYIQAFDAAGNLGRRIGYALDGTAPEAYPPQNPVVTVAPVSAPEGGGLLIGGFAPLALLALLLGAALRRHPLAALAGRFQPF